MNKFQKEVVKRRKKVVKVVGLGDWSLRFLTKLIRNRLKKRYTRWDYTGLYIEKY